MSIKSYIGGLFIFFVIAISPLLTVDASYNGECWVVSNGDTIYKLDSADALMDPNGITIPDVSQVQTVEVDPKTGKPTRVGFKILEDGRKVRYAKLSGEIIDMPADQISEQYGTMIRPENLDEVVEKPARESATKLKEATIAILEPVDYSSNLETTDSSKDIEKTIAKRRRGKRGGKRNRKK